MLYIKTNYNDENGEVETIFITGKELKDKEKELKKKVKELEKKQKELEIKLKILSKQILNTS